MDSDPPDVRPEAPLPPPTLELSTPLPLEEPTETDLHPPVSSAHWIYRHAIPVRLAHWINVLCLPILIMSGFQIFNAHPALYWGERSDRDRPILAMKEAMAEDGKIKGITTLFGRPFETTGVFGASKDASGALQRRGFPRWATLPSDQWLSMARRWHFFFAWIFVLNGLLFVFYSLASRHLIRDLFPTPAELRRIGGAVRDHLFLRHPAGEEAARYNVLQKIAYIGVVYILAPLIVLTGLTMSPRVDAIFPPLLTLFGGRQSARTIHFIACFAFIGYTLVHLFMVAVTGLWNNLRSMVVGRYRIVDEGAVHGKK